MRRSQLFAKTTKEVPADETAINAQLLIKAGFIHKELAGVYAILPLGLLVIEKIKNIVREEMNKLGAEELLMTNLQDHELWQKTDRWDDSKVDIWFKSKLQNNQPIGLAWSHEEPITDMMRNFIASYRDLPVYVYQFQTKLRNELRAKSGIMRSREFIMKDLYTYSLNEAEHHKIYEKVRVAYEKIFNRLDIGNITFYTYASGGAFTKFSHEFQTLTDAGEDNIYLDKTKKLAINKEVYTEELIKSLNIDKKNLVLEKASEVGNIFSFGTQKTKQLDLKYTGEDGKIEYVVLGSYGIGITRLMGVIAEVFSDKKGLVWPDSIAPATVYLASLGDNSKVNLKSDELYKSLTAQGIEVIYDDRQSNAGDKFADADLFGIPYRVVVSEKTLSSNSFEVKERAKEEVKNISKEALLNLLVKNNKALL